MFRRIPGALVCAAVVALLPAAAGSAAAQTKLLRFPDIHGERVVFSYAGDLWFASTAGGQATRLTAHPGLELFPRFSPDGSQIAFTGQYDGDEQVYVIPAAGGVPQQLTYYPARGPLAPRWGYDNQVYDWTPDGRSVLFRSLRYSTDLSDSRLFLAAVDGGLPVPLPMPESGAGDLSPDGTRVVYSPLFRDFRTWKRYEGGWAQELYIFDRETHAVERVTTHRRADRDPMWIGNAIYFTSDRTGTLNLYSYDLGSREIARLTDSDTWDVRWPGDDGAGRIVYELNGELQTYSIDDKSSRPIAITVPDDGLAMRAARVSAAGLIEDAELSPQGERALFVARGDVFTVPIEHGPVRNLTRSSSAHDKWARWSPDGRRIAYVSDAGGEDEIYLVEQDGSGEPEQLTSGGQGMRYAANWSPAGTHLASSDKDGRLIVVDVETREVIEVADEPRGPLRDYTWSPNGGHLAFSMTDPTDFSSIYIWSLAERRLHRVTDEYFHEWNPVWDPDGEFLYYLSDRQFAPQLGSFEWNYLVDRETGVYALALRKDVAHPLPPESDEVELDEAVEEGEDAPDEAEGGAAEDETGEDAADDDAPIVIDLDGLADRVARLPLPFENYGGLTATSGGVFVIRAGASYYGRASDARPALRRFTFEDRETKTIAEGIGGYALSRDGEQVLVREGRDWKVYTAAGDDPRVVSTAGLMVDRTPAEEWAQIFDEVWRRFRDFFYVENMHGYDWDGLRERYRPLLAHVAHRSDLNYVLGEMVAELNVSHAYITGGDWETPERPEVALPGAVFELDPAAGLYRLSEIFAGHNEEPQYRAPLTEIGVDARVGDYVLAIDGEDLAGTDNPYRLLRHRADSPVRLTLNDLADHRKRARGGLQPGDRRAPPALPDRGGGEPPQGVGDDRRAGRLPARAGYGCRRHSGVHQVVLRPDPQGGSGDRRARQRRRQRLADADRAAGPDRARHPLRPHVRQPRHVSRHRLSRPHGLHPRRGLGFRRRHLSVPLPRGRPRPADRQAVLGRRHRHHQPRPAARRRRGKRAAVRHERRRRELGGRERRRRAGHRGGQRPPVGHRRPRPAARTRGRGGAAHDAREPEVAARASRAPGQDAVGGNVRPFPRAAQRSHRMAH